MMWCHAMQCHVLCYIYTNILEKTVACIFHSETGGSWFPQNACQSLVDDMMAYAQRWYFWQLLVCKPRISWMNIYSVNCQLHVMCIVKIWSYHCGLFVQLIFACDQYVHGSMKDKTWPFQAVNTQKMDLKTPSSLQSWQFLNKNLSFESFFLAGVNHGCKLEVISIACFNM